MTPDDAVALIKEILGRITNGNQATPEPSCGSLLGTGIFHLPPPRQDSHEDDKGNCLHPWTEPTDDSYEAFRCLRCGVIGNLGWDEARVGEPTEEAVILYDPEDDA